ncbi:ABC transporter substrate-binding protein [Paenibacillus sp. FSL R7-0273]|uniref:ABC transporter substrate-binding protein n=1 Tax=Paenibacillus sp. FSL R7-0273 TaxID=1536772 RepID=UPI0004F5B862|nr:sugar ABC transporter substrate-binding protein [Paenibacillus sp. FSL R7-0273]AIQ48538.1 ABC transporter substrate-binding protein [Paenibacillus sp. FSL R7-0273]OMF87608.1 ABC transporter substrate-binding protein [Paenibacillus sp. FSL R7-0273]
MNYKRLYGMTFTAVLSVGLLAGCSGNNNNAQNNAAATTAPTGTNASASSEPSQEPVTLKWALWDWEATAYYKPLIEAYQKEHPNVTIEYVDLGSTDYMTMLSTQLSGGADLDILTIKDIPGYSNLVKQNHLEPLKGFMGTNSIDPALYGGTVEQIEVNDEVYALPFRSDFWIVYYNKDLFDKAGVEYPSNDMTFEQYDELARKMTSGSGAEKVYGAHYHTWRSAVQLFGILDGKNTVVDGSYDFLKPTYERILKEQEDGIVMDYATLKTSSTHYSGVFYNNSVAMMNMGSWFIATQIEKVKSGESQATNWGIVKYPHPDGVEAGTTLGTITSLAVNQKSEHKEAALDFMKFVTGEDGASVIASTGTIPAIKNDEVIGSITSIDGFPADDNSKAALTTVQTYLEMPMHEKSADIEVILNEAHDNIMTKNATIDEGLKDMNTRVQSLLNN